MDLSGSLGDLCITLGSELSHTSDKAGKTSITRFYHKICNASNGIGICNSIPRNINIISLKLLENKKYINFSILSKIILPSLIALTMVLKQEHLRLDPQELSRCHFSYHSL